MRRAPSASPCQEDHRAAGDAVADEQGVERRDHRTHEVAVLGRKVRRDDHKAGVGATAGFPLSVDGGTMSATLAVATALPGPSPARGSGRRRAQPSKCPPLGLRVMASGPRSFDDGPGQRLVEQKRPIGRYPTSRSCSRGHASFAAASAYSTAQSQFSTCPRRWPNTRVAVRVRWAGTRVSPATRSTSSASVRSGTAPRADLTARMTSQMPRPPARSARRPRWAVPEDHPGLLSHPEASINRLAAADNERPGCPAANGADGLGTTPRLPRTRPA